MSDSPETPESEIQVRNEGPVRVLTLNRPAALNAFTAAMLAEAREALAEAAADPQVRAVVITGAGRAFSAGQDLGDPLVKPDTSPGAAPKDIGHLLDGYYIPLALQLRAMPVPTVAAVNGVAAGAGANFALGCDLVIAGEGASFLQAFSKIGLIPDCGGTWLLPRLVGRAKAMQLALLGDKLKAAEAAAIGLIARAVPDAELMAEALITAHKLAAMPSRALAETRRLIDQAMTQDFDDALRVEALSQSELGFAHDYREGVQAFMEKRSPQFKDR